MKKLLALTVALALSLSAVGCGSTDNNTNSDTIDNANYRVGVGSYTTASDSSPSVEGENGKGVVSTTYATVIFDENDVIRKVYIDEVQSKIYFDGNGQLVNKDAYSEIRSKRELGDEYGMKAASDIGKEWYEQINSLESWLVGKNIKEISDNVMNMSAYGTEDDYAGNIANDAKDAVDGVADGAKDIVDGVVDGAKDIIDGNNGENSGTAADGTNTAEGITNNTDSMADSNSDNMTGDTQTDSTPPAPDREDMNDMAEDNLDWEEDLKSSVTIDLTNIQRALQKAYANAR